MHTISLLIETDFIKSKSLKYSYILSIRLMFAGLFAIYFVAFKMKLIYEGDFKSSAQSLYTERNYLFYKILLQAFSIIPIPPHDSFLMF